MMASLGPYLQGACPPHPDTGDALSALAGVMKRIGSEPPQIDEKILEEFSVYVYLKVREWFPKLNRMTDVSFPTWLEGTQYNRARKHELQAVSDKLEELSDYDNLKHEDAKSFAKAEVYPELKYHRCIFSKTDAFKVQVGPYFKAIETEVYKHPAFVKHVPVKDRPAHICKVLDPKPGETIDANDYSSFESLFREKLMRICEMQLYEHMTSELPEKQRFLDRCEAMMDWNSLVFKWFTVFLRATRLSGGMETSLGNGVSNLLFGHFLAERKGCTDIRMVVEGDDSLMVYNGPRLEATDFENLGLNCKLVHHEQIETASFCGIIFDPVDRKTITDPRKVLATFGWGDGKYARCKKSKKLRMLRCKALSLAYQYPGCPIVWALAEYGLRVTRGMNIGAILDRDASLGWWKRSMLQEAVSHQKDICVEAPGPGSRMLVEQLYGISVETQVRVEEYLLAKTDIGPIDCPPILDLVHEDWRYYYNYYVRDAPVSSLTKPIIGIKTREPSVLFNELMPANNDHKVREILTKRGRNRKPFRTRDEPLEAVVPQWMDQSKPAATLGVKLADGIEEHMKSH